MLYYYIYIYMNYGKYSTDNMLKLGIYGFQ